MVRADASNQSAVSHVMSQPPGTRPDTMFERLKGVLAAVPSFEDEDDARRAAVLNSLIVSMSALLVAGGTLGMLFLFANPVASGVWMGLCFALLLSVRTALSTGHPRLASGMIVTGLWLLFFALALLSGGIESIVLTFFIPLTVVAGLLCGLRGALIVASGSSAATLALAFAHRAGLAPPTLFPVPPHAAWLDVTLALGLSVAPLHLVLSGLQGALRAAREQLGLRKIAEEALSRSEERFRTIFESINDAVFVHDLSHRIVLVNQRGLELWGISNPTLPLPLSLISLGEAPYTEVEAAAYLDRAAAGEQLVFEWRARNAQGRLFWVEVNMRRASIGGDDCILVTARDVSERKRAEEERLRLESQLRQSQRLEAIGRLAGGVAHDFNNLLTAIMGNVSLVQAKTPTGDSRAEWLAAAAKAAEGAAGLTRQLLTFSRRQVIEPRDVSLNDLIAGMRPILAQSVTEQIHLNTALAPELWMIRVDPGQLENVIVNLVVNARDAMPSGGRLVLETANAVVEPGRGPEDLVPGEYVRLTVSDTGTGMTPEVRQAIFEPFFTTKPRGEGTGLGLAMVFGAVKQHGGGIEVETELGRGTSFHLYLPRTASSPRTVEKRPDAGALPRGSERIMVVEDSASVRGLIVTTLRSLGYAVEAFDSAESALAAVEQAEEAPSLLFTDVVLPGISGRQLAIRLQERWPSLPVLFTSGYAENVIVHHGVLEHGVQFLGKPFGAEHLARKVRSMFEVLSE